MNALFTLTLTEKGRQPEFQVWLTSTGFDRIDVLAIRTWRTRDLPAKDWAVHSVEGNDDGLTGVHIHDEEWICVGDGSVFTLCDMDLELLNDAIDNELYTVS